MKLSTVKFVYPEYDVTVKDVPVPKDIIFLKGVTVSAPGIIYPYEVPLTPKAILSVLVLEVLKVTVLVDRPDRVS